MASAAYPLTDVNTARGQSWTVIQAEAHGVTGSRPDGTTFMQRRLPDVAPGGFIRLVRPPKGIDPYRVLEFARGEVGAEYGVLTVLGVAFDKVTPAWLHFPIRRPGTWICSALAGESLRLGGFNHRWDDVYDVDPASLLSALLLAGGTEIPLSQAVPGDIVFAHSRGYLSAAIRFGQWLNHEPDYEVNHVAILDSTTGAI